MTADELLFFCLISELMARDIQQNYKTVSGSPPSTGINPRILTAPHCEVQQPPKRWLRLWAGKRWVTKHLIFGVNNLGSLRSPSHAPCATTHPTSRHLTATQDTYYNQRVKFHKLLFASGVSAARLRRWLATGNKQHRSDFAASSPEGTLVFLLRSGKPSTNRSTLGCHTLLVVGCDGTCHLPKHHHAEGWPEPSDETISSIQCPLPAAFHGNLQTKIRHVQDGQAPSATTRGRGELNMKYQSHGRDAEEREPPAQPIEIRNCISCFSSCSSKLRNFQKFSYIL